MTAAGVRGWLCLGALPLGLAFLGLLTLPVLGHGPGSGDGPPWAEDRWGPGSPTDAAVTDPGALAAVLVLVAAAGLLLRHRRPEVALAITTAATGAYLALGYPYGPILLTLAVAVYVTARRLPLVPALLWACGSLVVLVLLLLTRSVAPTSLLPAAPWLALPFTIGLVRRQSTDARTRARAEADRRLVEAERLRVAQEVHDVVGHGLAAIQMQADIALHVRERDPEQPVRALQAISTASEEALTELRATLTGVRSGGTAPTPGLAGIDALRERVRASGVEVDLAVVGDVAGLPGPVDLAAYRIVQEALTNVVRHSADRAARVRITREPQALHITVSNRQDPTDPTDSTGRRDRPERDTPALGIDGMRRRARQLGGELTAGEQEGHFTVRAVIPLEENP